MRIAQYLRELVAEGRPGGRLPSDAELCDRFGVSRMTARQAVQLLVSERLLYRKRGQGTFIAARVVPRLLGSPLSFTESMRRRGLKASSELLETGMRTPTADQAQALGLRPGQQVVLVERLRLADDLPMSIEHVILHPRCAAVLHEDLVNGSLHAACERLGFIPMRAQARVSARTVTAREAHLLQSTRSEVVLCEDRIISDQHGEPLESTETRYLASRYEFEAVLHRNDHDVMG